MCLSACVTLLNHYVNGEGHPVLLITSGVNFFLCGPLLGLLLWKKDQMFASFLLLYYVVHALSVILTYGDWLPESMTHSKYELRYQNVLNYSLVMVLPIQSNMRSLLVMAPLFLLATYVQLDYEARLAKSIRGYLPPDLQAQVPTGEGTLFAAVYKMALISAAFCGNQYA